MSLRLNPDVTMLVKTFDHPLSETITELRKFILEQHSDLKETIKWNGPNFVFRTDDRITLRVQSPKIIQIIFHCGVKKQTLQSNYIDHESPLLEWKSNDRAIISLKSVADFSQNSNEIAVIIAQWLNK